MYIFLYFAEYYCLSIGRNNQVNIGLWDVHYQIGKNTCLISGPQQIGGFVAFRADQDSHSINSCGGALDTQKVNDNSWGQKRRLLVSSLGLTTFPQRRQFIFFFWRSRSSSTLTDESWPCFLDHDRPLPDPRAMRRCRDCPQDPPFPSLVRRVLRATCDSYIVLPCPFLPLASLEFPLLPGAEPCRVELS